MRLQQVKELPEVPIVVLVECVLMPNGELMHLGKSLGFQKDLSRICEAKFDD